MPPKKSTKVSPIPFDCPLCNQPVSNTTYVDHCSTKHNLLPKEQCPWCFGHTHLRDRGKRHTNACCEQFMKAIPRPVPLFNHTEEEPVAFDLRPMCSAVVDPGPFPLPLADLKLHDTLQFQSDSLNVAAASIRLFLNGVADWYHIMIREESWKHFLAAVEKEPVQMLPFTCSCRGGVGAMHLHFIVRSPKDHFLKVWKKMLPQNNRNVRKQMLESPAELLDAIDSLCQEESACNFTFRAGGEKQKVQSDVAVSLPRMHKMVLAFLWEGGIMDLIHKRYASMEASILAPVALLSEGMWVVKFRDLPGLETNLVLPVSPNFQPCGDRKTDFFLHLDHGDKFFFEKVSKSDQAAGGSVLVNIIGEHLYYPTFYQQKCINLIKPNMVNMEKLETIFEEKQQTIELLEESMNELKTTNKALKRKYETSEEELKMLQNKHIRYLEQENDFLRMKCKDLKGH